jgi:hypothetical protein
MAITKVRQVLFEEASASSDWRFPYRLIVPAMDGWDDLVDEVVLGLSPDFLMWDDYGLRSRAFPPPTADSTTTPWYQASSRDGSGVVTLVDPNGVDILVPWNVIRTMGPGTINVGVQYRNLVTDARSSLISGRLPLVDTVV